MAICNDVRLIGYVGAKPHLTTTRRGQVMAVLVAYAREGIDDLGEAICQARRCVSFGALAQRLAQQADTGRHIHVRGRLHSTVRRIKGETRYYAQIVIDAFVVSPQQHAKVVKAILAEVMHP